ncbi:MAG: CHAT domain-containing protein [Chloroflexota bacterium]
MIGKTALKDLIQPFYTALNRRDFETCERILSKLIEITNANLWRDLFQTILDYVKDNDSGKAENSLKKLLQEEIEPELRGRTLHAIAKINFVQGRWQDSNNNLINSLPYFDEQPVEQAKIYQNIAITLRVKFEQAEVGPNALSEAKINCLKALEILNGLGEETGDKLRILSFGWNTLGTIHLNLGELDNAVRCYSQFFHYCQLLNDNFGMTQAVKNFGEILHKKGDFAKASEKYEYALAYFQNNSAPQEIIDVLANLGKLYQDSGEHQTALHFYQESIDCIDSQRSTISSDEIRISYFVTAAEIYANMILLSSDMQEYHETFDVMERARARGMLDLLDSRTSALAQGIGETVNSKLAPQPVKLSVIQQMLPENALLLYYFTTGLYESPAARFRDNARFVRHRFPRRTTLLFAITHQALEVHDLDLDPNRLLPGQLENASLRRLTHEAKQPHLYGMLLAPIEHLIHHKEKICIIPHGPLHYIPFHSLMTPDGVSLLRLDGPSITYAPSASILLHLHRSAGLRKQKDKLGCLALGYNGHDTGTLYFAEDEARDVVRLVGGHAWAGHFPKKAKLLTEAAAYRYLHFACHGQFDAGAPLDSYLELGPDERLTARDVLESLRLQSDLVTISACESGSSYVQRGDELMGFTRAFIAAGTSAMLITVWQVDDLATRVLMQKFYEQVQKKVPFAEALKNAQLYLRQLTRHEVRQIATKFAGDQTLDWTALRFQDLVNGNQNEPAYEDLKYWAAFMLISGF